MTQSQQEIRQAPDLWSKIQPIKSPYSGTILNFIKLTNQHTLIDLMVTSLRVNNSNITQVQNYLHLTDFRPVILKLEVFSPVGSSFNLFFRVFGNLTNERPRRQSQSTRGCDCSQSESVFCAPVWKAVQKWKLSYYVKHVISFTSEPTYEAFIFLRRFIFSCSSRFAILNRIPTAPSSAVKYWLSSTLPRSIKRWDGLW